MINPQWLYRMNQILRERALYRVHQSILIAVSGGQDSMLLATMFYHLQGAWQWRLSLVYCDHQWHHGSKAQAQHVARFTSSLGLVGYTCLPVMPISSEGEARSWRYAIMEHVAYFHPCNAISLGHNATDRIETMLANCFRGTGLEGMQALNWHRSLPGQIQIPFRLKSMCLTTVYQRVTYRWHFHNIQIHTQYPLYLVRPLLCMTREQIRKQVNKANIPVSHDPTNCILSFRRNRIRHQLLPYLRKYFNPRIDASLSILAENVDADVRYLNALINSLYTANGMSLPLWRSFPINLQRRLLKKLLGTAIPTAYSFDTLEKVRGQLTQTIPPPYTITLTPNRRLVINNNIIQIQSVA
jgi:tRNA(Ile)-lysidine synthase